MFRQQFSLLLLAQGQCVFWKVTVHMVLFKMWISEGPVCVKENCRMWCFWAFTSVRNHLVLQLRQRQRWLVEIFYKMAGVNITLPNLVISTSNTWDASFKVYIDIPIALFYLGIMDNGIVLIVINLLGYDVAQTNNCIFHTKVRLLKKIFSESFSVTLYN